MFLFTMYSVTLKYNDISILNIELLIQYDVVFINYILQPAECETPDQKDKTHSWLKIEL